MAEYGVGVDHDDDAVFAEDIAEHGWFCPYIVASFVGPFGGVDEFVVVAVDCGFVVVSCYFTSGWGWKTYRIDSD